MTLSNSPFSFNDQNTLNTQQAAALLGSEQLAMGGLMDQRITRIAPLSRANEHDLAFADQVPPVNVCIQQFANRKIGCLLLPQSVLNQEGLLTALLEHHIACAYIVCRDVRLAFALLAGHLYQHSSTSAHIHHTAVIDSSAQIAAGVSIGAYSVIGAHCQIGKNVFIANHVSIGDHVIIGDGSVIEPGVRLGNDVIMGAQCHLYPNCVIGADGFGYALDSRPETLNSWVAIPQIGRVQLGNNVDVGTNTTIDRGTMDDTVIEDGVKIDNQVQIGHNCRIGRHSIIAGCVGIAGSTLIGQYCRIGGAAMITGHLSIAAHTEISPASVIFSSIAEAGKYTGFFPFAQHHDWKKMSAMIRGLLKRRSP
jgi:UDP-3-O-[3-hydroxymyristoyl] glucosamine N-acyltransferase